MNETTTRECGSCSACCYVCPVEELQKPLLTRCPHQNPAAIGPGCRIYSERPGACAAYRCSWLEGELDLDDRPDRVGVLFEHTRLELRNGRDLLVLLGMTFGEPEDPARLLRHARPGTLVAIADSSGQHPEHNLIAGTPQDCRGWLGFLADMERGKAELRHHDEPPRETTR